MGTESTLGGMDMKNINVEITLVNDYYDGSNNGKKIFIQNCKVNDIEDMEEIKEYLRVHHEYNMCDMWEITGMEEVKGGMDMFNLGQVVGTPGVLESVNRIEINNALSRHKNGDWGEVCKDDWEENDKSVELGYRILSAYESTNGVKFWIITEADRSCTTILLPNEY